MSDYSKWDKEELIQLIARLQPCLLDGTCPNEEHLLHDLHVQQVELEMQNRELSAAQQQLKESRDRYADLYDFAPVGYLTLGEDGRVLEANLTVAAMFGQQRAGLVGKPFASWLGPGQNAQFFDHLRQAFSSSANVIAELEINIGGRIQAIQLESAAVKNGLDKQRSCRTILTDITEQKQMLGTLMQTRSELDALLNAIPAAVYFKDLELRNMRLNKYCADLAGLPVEEMLGKTGYAMFPQAAAEEFERSDRMVLDSGKTVIGQEQEITDGHGDRHWISTSKAPYFGADGKLAGVVGVSIDVTAIREAEHRSRELLRENRRLTRRLFTIQERERRHLARELHDELGQWLTAIQAEAQAIRTISGAEANDKYIISAQSIIDSADQIHQVIRRILLRLRPTLLEQLGLVDSLQELVEQWQRHHPDIDCELVMGGPLDSLSEILDITVYRIVQEALTNIANHADARRVSINLHCAPDALLLSVEDDGKGMDPHLPRVGLGLLGIRERVLAAEGGFALNSTPGQGLRIDIEIPLTPLEEESEKFEQQD